MTTNLEKFKHQRQNLLYIFLQVVVARDSVNDFQQEFSELLKILFRYKLWLAIF